jgi:uncharacterized protein (DUF169 family)
MQGRELVMKDIEEFRKAGLELFDRLHLATYPVAIEYIRDESEFVTGIVRPSSNGQKWSLCQAFTYSRRWGTTVGMTQEDNFCVPATVWHRWVDVPWEEFIQSQLRQGWHSGEEAERKRCEYGMRMIGEENIEKAAGYAGFISSPLPYTRVIPDSVLVYGNAENVTHIIHALSYGGEHFPASTFEGFGESCMKGGLVPFLTGVPQVVVPGMGDRAFSGTYDYEIAIGFPGTLLPEVMENLFKTGGRLNMGLPVRTLLPTGITESITPGFQYLRERIDERKGQ